MTFCRRLQIAALLMLCCLSLAHGQNNGNTGTFTTARLVFSNQGAPTTSAILPNIGQASHFLVYCFDSGSTGIQVWLESSFDGVSNWVPISETGTESSNNAPTDNCNVLQAGGYFQNVRVRLNAILSGHVTAWYSASSGPMAAHSNISLSTNGFSSPIACDNTQVFHVNNNSNATLVLGASISNVIYVCGVVVSFDDTPTATGTVSLFQSPHSSGCTVGGGVFLLVTAATGANVPFGGGLGTIFRTSNSGALEANDLCANSTGVGTGVEVTVNYALF